ncbi:MULTISPECIES: hypothetical protein [Halobacterium]|nr:MULTISPECIES: hypothetical protein [Halobacterium]MBB6090779.1 hypothetical protein [Halobacterium salinarum]MCF2166108.1 hypothetical protein [Halobacterium salinarum]MCF2166798.1 hypothetical protein [Halobacterium salinarum]MCF2206465.1 hypothetical protein [Halobacterium salinarum]MCF2239681.1 hypothetical protein [Halobacterium salinarum]
MDREAAVDRVEALLDTVIDEEMPVPVREVWAYGDVALGLDPVDRLDVYLTKDVLLRGDDADRADEFEREYGVAGVGKTVRASWADAHPEHVRANDSGHVAPERCLGAHLVGDDEPIHLEVCNAGFEDNVTQRLEGALATETYEHVLDPRGVCVYADGRRGTDAMAKLRAGELVFPTLAEALEMLGADEADAELAADAVDARRDRATGATVRGDVV